MAFSKDFSFEIVESLATLSTDKNGWTKELNLVSFNGGEPKYDIRTWDSAHEKMGKGISFTKEELDVLKQTIEKLG